MREADLAVDGVDFRIRAALLIWYRRAVSDSDPNPENPIDPQVDEFLRHLASDKGASIYTQRNYRQALVEFCDWFQSARRETPAWDDLVRDDFREFLRFLGRKKLSRAAIQLRFCALRSFYKYMIRQGIVSASPIRNIALPKLERRLPRFLTVEQLKALLAAPGQEMQREAEKESFDPAAYFRDAAILETIYSCGLRVSEVCGLRVGDIHWDEQLVRVRGKGKKERMVPIGAPALESIRAYWKHLRYQPTGEMPVFLSYPGKETAPSPRLVQLRLKKYLIAAGLDPSLTPHKLRHSYATHMLDAGANLREIQELLGHAHLVTTQVYTHITAERLKSAYRDAHPRA